MFCARQDIRTMMHYWKILFILLSVIFSVSTQGSPVGSVSSTTSAADLEVAVNNGSSSNETTTEPNVTSTSDTTTIPKSTTAPPTATTSGTTNVTNLPTPGTKKTTPSAAAASESTAAPSATAASESTAAPSASTTPEPTTATLATTPTLATTLSTTTIVTTTSGSTANTQMTSSASTNGTSPPTPSTVSTTILPTDTSPSTATAASVSTVTTPATPYLEYLISETNLLLTNDSSRHFVEIQVAESARLNSTWLVIHNASTDTAKGLLLKTNINISNFTDGLYVYDVNETALGNTSDLESVLIALYADEESADHLTIDGLLDILLYSSSGNISPGLKELFTKIMNQNLIIDYKKLNISEPVSLSRCSDKEIANNVAVLTNESWGEKKNFCNLTKKSPLEMKLTRKSQPCSTTSPNDFQSTLISSVIPFVNENKRCGLAAYMLTDLDVKCIKDSKELDVKFTVSSAFLPQVTLIQDGYKDFLSQRQTLNVKGEEYYLSNCYSNCFDGTTPPTSADDDRIRVTVAVVVSCIGVFLLVLLFVVLYLRRKRKGILQFHMTRLDEDDDLVGDMDDFVGNQGPTFHSYR